jgi:hypothetical protein
MIQGIIPGTGLVTTGGSSMQPYISPGSQSAGILRYNTNLKNIEVYDGVSWLALSSSHTQISLDGPTQEAVQWVRRRMEQEKRLEELARQHPAVADAAAAVAQAQEQLDIVTALVQL